VKENRAGGFRADSKRALNLSEQQIEEWFTRRRGDAKVEMGKEMKLVGCRLSANLIVSRGVDEG
jgi:hypothetical protein